MARAPESKSAWTRLLDALTRRSLTRLEARRRLREKGYGPDEIEAAIDKALELRLVDERAIACNHAARRAAEGRRGPARVRAELVARGLPEEAIDDAIAEAFPAEDADAQLRRAFERLGGRRGLPADRRERDRLLRRLLRAGFAPERVRALVDELGEESFEAERDDEDHDDACP